MSLAARDSLRTGVVAVAPVLLLVTLGSHPHLPGRQPNLEALAAAVRSDPTRWGVVHLATGVASAVVALAFIAVRSHLHELGEDRWSAAGLPFVVVGSTLYAMLPGMELAPLAAFETGADVAAAQEALLPWFVPVLVVGGVTFAVGMCGFSLGVIRSGVVTPRLARVVAAGFLVMAVSRFVPLSAVQFYVQGLAGCVALLPLAYSMARASATRVETGRPLAPST